MPDYSPLPASPSHHRLRTWQTPLLTPKPPKNTNKKENHHSSHRIPCVNCGGPTAYPSPPPPSSNLIYIPICFPAFNLPPNPTNAKEAIIRTPVPQPEKVVPLSLPYEFEVPVKRISSQDDIARFHSSSTCAHFLSFVISLSESIKSHQLFDPCHVSPAASTIAGVLEKLISFVDEIPPAPQAARYGNSAYCTWRDRMSSDAEPSMLLFLPSHLFDSSVELVPYFTDSFSNASRIDYGTGHETNFAARLYCLARLKILKERIIKLWCPTFL